jgi:hypothetical protein
MGSERDDMNLRVLGQHHSGAGERKKQKSPHALRL